MPPARTPCTICRSIAIRHHAYLHRELPLLSELALYVRSAHDADDEQLSELVAVLARLHAELEAHVSLQEHMLFPYCAELERGRQVAPAEDARAQLERHARELEAEIRQLDELTGGFSTAGGISAEHRVLIVRLAALVADTEQLLRTERELMGLRRVVVAVA